MTTSKPTLNQIQSSTKPSEDFYIKLEDNIYEVKFIGFKMRDIETNQVYHEFYAQDKYQLDIFASHILEYIFPHQVLKCKTIGTNLNFCVGDKPVTDLVFIEKHFLEGELAKSYQFDFPFFMPNSVNNIEFIYHVPEMSNEIKEKISKKEDINAFSDTFIFADGDLIIHRRAKYVYKSD